MSHTEGRLETSDRYIVKGLQVIATCISAYGFVDSEANARRLVACWNALMPVPTEWLEQYNRDPNVDSVVDSIITENAKLRIERDELAKVLKAVTDFAYRQICQHEETHRGGSIWEICDSCGEKWADDEGGKPETSEPEPIKLALNILAKYPEAS